MGALGSLSNLKAPYLFLFAQYIVNSNMHLTHYESHHLDSESFLSHLAALFLFGFCCVACLAYQFLRAVT